MINAGSCKPQLTKGIVNAVGWCVENRIIYAQEAIINCSCDTLNWLKNQIGFFKKEAQLNSIWDEIENNDGVYLVWLLLKLLLLLDASHKYLHFSPFRP